MSLRQAYYGDYKQNRKKRRAIIAVVSAVILMALLLAVYCIIDVTSSHSTTKLQSNNDASAFSICDEIPAYVGKLSIEINGNVPFFEESEITAEPFKDFSSLDSLGRCGRAFACLGLDTMPTEERGSIGAIKPSGWHTVRYDDVIEDKYLYNRCHLIAFMLSGENDNEQNLITGTRNLNIAGMLPYENETADYIKRTGNHVIYRVTPYFYADNLVATGVLMEAFSVEDYGAGLCFNVFIYNVQPGIVIDYSTGDSWAE